MDPKLIYRFLDPFIIRIKNKNKTWLTHSPHHIRAYVHSRTYAPDGTPGHSFRPDCCAEFLVHGTWSSRNPQHALTSQFIKMPPMVYCDEVPTETSVLRAQVAVALSHHGNNDDYKDCGVGSIFSSSLEHLTEKK